MDTSTPPTTANASPPGASPAKTPRSQRAEITRERILQAAANAFERRGYLGVNLNEVVRELGLTKGALYYFFPTKEALAAEIVGRHFGAWEPQAAKMLAENDNIVDAVREMSMLAAQDYVNDAYARAGMRLCAERNLINADLPAPFPGWVDGLTQALEEGKTRGQVEESVDPARLADMLVAFFVGAQMACPCFGPPAGVLDLMRTFWSTVEPALRPREG